jgi:hypothetical protein
MVAGRRHALTIFSQRPIGAAGRKHSVEATEKRWAEYRAKQAAASTAPHRFTAPRQVLLDGRGPIQERLS